MTVPFWTLAPLLLAAAPQTVFVLVYALRPLGAGEWWRDRVGRALCVKSTALALVLDLLAARVLSHGWPGWTFAAPEDALATAETAGYWLVLVGVTYQLGVLLRQRLEERGRGQAAARS